jgi:hypothetical protein
MKTWALITSTILAASFAISSPANAKGNEHKHDKVSYEKKRHITHKKVVSHVPRHTYQQKSYHHNSPVTVIKVDLFNPLLKVITLPHGVHTLHRH